LRFHNNAIIIISSPMRRPCTEHAYVTAARGRFIFSFSNLSVTSISGGCIGWCTAIHLIPEIFYICILYNIYRPHTHNILLFIIQVVKIDCSVILLRDPDNVMCKQVVSSLARGMMVVFDIHIGSILRWNVWYNDIIKCTILCFRFLRNTSPCGFISYLIYYQYND